MRPADAVFLKPQQVASSERDETARLAVELVERQRALAFRRAHLHARDEPAEILISLGGLDEDGNPQERGREGCVGAKAGQS